MRYQIRHARVQFGGNVILRDVNFEVHDREKIAVVGRNGCGKTTLLKLIAGDIEMSNQTVTRSAASRWREARRSVSCGRSTLWTRR